MPLNTEDVEYVLNEVRIKVDGSSDAGIKQEMWGVIKEFLQDTNAWIEHQKFLVTRGVHQYPVSPRDGGQIVRLIGVLDGNRVPVNASMSRLGQLEIHRRIDISSISTAPDDHTTASNHPWSFAVVKNIALPSTREGIPVAPDFVMKVYSGTIVDGIIGKMMIQSGKTFSNLPLGKYHLARFRDGIGIARNDTWNQNVQGGQRWRFPSSFSTCTQRGGSVGTWPGESF